MSYCRDCAFANNINGAYICTFFKVQKPIILNGAACQFFQHKQYITQCDNCKANCIGAIIVQNGDTTKYLCGQCAAKIGYCQSCVQVSQCAFETDPSPIPKTISYRNGNTIFTSSSKNPERIAITCKKGCPCWNDEEQYCYREENTCAKYKINM